MITTTLTTPCVEWDGARDDDGYGKVRVEGKVERVHRAVYAADQGPIPEGMVVLHRCDNPPCYRLDHLRLGTHADNVRDKVSKGRQAGPAPKATCPRDHPYDAENTYVDPAGKRHCRACHRQRAREARAQ